MPYDKKPNKRPDIATLGASLLADKRSYSKKKDRSKDDMKDLGKLLLLQMGIGIGNKVLKDRSANFVNNEQVRAQKIQWQSAQARAKPFIERQQKMDLHSGGELDWQINENIPLMTQMYKEEHNERTLPDPLVMNPWVLDKATKLAKEQLVAHKAGYSAAMRLGTEENYDAMVELNNKRPENTGEWLMSKAAGLFSGTSSKQRDQQAINLMGESGMLKAAGSVNLATKLYNETSNLRSSRELAQMLNESEYQGRPYEVVSTKDELKTISVNGKSFSVKVQETVETNGQQTRTKIVGSEEKDRLLMRQAGGGRADENGYLPPEVEQSPYEDIFGNKHLLEITTVKNIFGEVQATTRHIVELPGGVNDPDKNSVSDVAAEMPDYKMQSQTLQLKNVISLLDGDGDLELEDKLKVYRSTLTGDFVDKESFQKYEMSRVAALGSQIESRYDITEEAAQQIAATAYINRIEPNVDTGLWFNVRSSVDSAKIKYNDKISSAEMIQALSRLEESNDPKAKLIANDINISSIVTNKAFFEEFRGLSRAQQIKVFKDYADNPNLATGKLKALTISTSVDGTRGRSPMEQLAEIINRGS